MLGWSPTHILEPREGGGFSVTQTEPEWDYTERHLALALQELEEQICKGCGGDLSLNLTDKHPMEDDGDGHFHRAKHLWCRQCVSASKLEQRQRPLDEEVEGTPADNFPRARYTTWERLPIPATT